MRIVVFLLVIFSSSCFQREKDDKEIIDFGTYTSSRGVKECIESFKEADSLIRENQIKFMMVDTPFYKSRKSVLHFKDFMYDKYKIEVVFKNYLKPDYDIIDTAIIHKLIRNTSISQICYKERVDMYLAEKYKVKDLESFFVSGFKKEYPNYEKLVIAVDLKGYYRVTENRVEKNVTLLEKSLEIDLRRKYKISRLGSIGLRLYINEEGKTDSIVVLKNDTRNHEDLINHLSNLEWNRGIVENKEVRYRRDIYFKEDKQENNDF